jgi:hypothetical protein
VEEPAALLLRQWWERVWHQGDVEAVHDLFTDPYIRHTRLGNVVTPLAEYKRILVDFQRVLHGAVTTIDDEVVAGDRIWARCTSRGVNLETGEGAVATWLIIERLEGGKFAEGWISLLAGIDWTS